MTPGSYAGTVNQAIELSRQVYESASARNDERANARSLDPVERARAAKRRELEALDQALELHELAARLNESLGRPAAAAAARHRAERARHAMIEARQERQLAEQLLARRQAASTQ
jgi:hypothetical protein